MSNEDLEYQKQECENALLILIKESDSGREFLFVRGVLEKLIYKINERLGVPQ